MSREGKMWLHLAVVLLVVAASSSFVDSAATSPLEAAKATSGALPSPSSISSDSTGTGVSSPSSGSGTGSSDDSDKSSSQRKRAVEDIQFGNQQNLPLVMLDDAAYLGPFPSSEVGSDDEANNVETAVQQLEGAGESGSGAVGSVSPELEDDEIKEQLEENEKAEDVLGPHVPSTPYRSGPRLGAVYRNFYSPIRVARAPRLGPQSPYLNAWDMPFLLQDQLLPARRRRSAPRPSRGHSALVPDNALVASRRRKRELGNHYDFSKELTRFQKDPAFAQMLASIMESELTPDDNYDSDYGVNKRRLPHGLQDYGAARSSLGPAALSSRAHTRYAPQPKVIPNYLDRDATVEDLTNLALSLLRQRQPQTYPEVNAPVYRRSGLVPSPKYRYLAVPGYKRSAAAAPATTAFNQRQPAKKKRTSKDNGGVYSLAAMLGAEKDQATQRIRRVAM